MSEAAPMVSRRAKYSAGLYAAACALVAFPALAVPVTEREREACRADYQRYCRIYPLGSDALHTCMSRAIRRLSRSCVEALVDAGEMTRAQADKLRKKPGHAQRLRHKHPHRQAKR
jgi:hypothetical protein